MAQSVHFRDLEDTVNAVKSTGYEAWSVWEKNLLLCKGVGHDDLHAFLSLLADSATNAIYTVRYYAKFTDKDEIKNTTPHDGAFNFRLNGDNQEITQVQYASLKYSNELTSKVSALEEKFDRLCNALEADNNAVDEKPNSLGVIGEIIAHPAISPMIPQLLSALFGTAPGQSQQRPQIVYPATVGNVPDQDKLQLERAVLKLQQHNPKLSEHLTKLSLIAERDPATFAMILTSLDNYITQ